MRQRIDSPTATVRHAVRAGFHGESTGNASHDEFQSRCDPAIRFQSRTASISATVPNFRRGAFGAALAISAESIFFQSS